MELPLRRSRCAAVTRQRGRDRTARSEQATRTPEEVRALDTAPDRPSRQFRCHSRSDPQWPRRSSCSACRRSRYCIRPRKAYCLAHRVDSVEAGCRGAKINRFFALAGNYTYFRWKHWSSSVEVHQVHDAEVSHGRARHLAGHRATSAKMFLFKDSAWQQVKEMSMEAYLSMSPSFDYSVPDTVYRFVVMSRRIVPVSPEGQYVAVAETTRTTIWHFK
jgi:hypothetical protein